MNLPDLANGAFEATGGCFVWMNVYRLWRDRQVRGTFWPATLVFTAWGIFNLYYYPHLGQWLSFSGGLVIVLANAAWVTMAIRWRNR